KWPRSMRPASAPRTPRPPSNCTNDGPATRSLVAAPTASSRRYYVRRDGLAHRIGPSLAFSWLTVLPVRGPDTVDRKSAAIAIAWAPVVGASLGALACGVLWLLTAAGASSAVAGLVTVGVLALSTRGMHLDGLADTADGLGSYGPPERAREIMKSGSTGPFGVAAIVFTVALQAFSFAALADEGRWFAVILAVALARVAVVAACRSGTTAAPGTGFGALVAGTQSPITIAAWTLAAV